MYRPTHFAIEELVPKHVAKHYGVLAFQFLDDRMLQTIDSLRKAFGPVIINTWHSQTLIDAYGYREWSGLRTLGYWTEQYGMDLGIERYNRSFSQHKYGRAFDALFRDFTAQQIRAQVRMAPGRFPYLRAMETDVDWFHGDVRNVEPLMEFAP